MELVRVTEAAALSAAPFMGRGDGKAGDAAAVRAMRAVLRTVRMRGRVVIGEGEKDDAPMLFNGEEVGTGEAPELDLAVDPVEGTRLLALGRPNAIAVVAAAPAGGMWDPAGSFYAEKLVVERAAAGAVDLRLPPPRTSTAPPRRSGARWSGSPCSCSRSPAMKRSCGRFARRGPG
jgi:fructose-1,6-bisphosphatase II